MGHSDDGPNSPARIMTQLYRVASSAKDANNFCPARKPRTIAWQTDAGNDFTSVVNCFDNPTGAGKFSKSALQMFPQQDQDYALLTETDDVLQV